MLRIVVRAAHASAQSLVEVRGGQIVIGAAVDYQTDERNVLLDFYSSAGRARASRGRHLYVLHKVYGHLALGNPDHDGGRTDTRRRAPSPLTTEELPGHIRELRSRGRRRHPYRLPSRADTAVQRHHLPGRRRAHAGGGRTATTPRNAKFRSSCRRWQ